MTKLSDKDIVLNALNLKNYRIEYQPSNTIFECKDSKGASYYVQWDMHRLGKVEDYGYFKFIVEANRSYNFKYNMNDGNWSGDELCNDQEVINKLESLDEFIDSTEYSGYPEWQIYCKVHGLNENIGYYWYEDEDCPCNM